MGCTSSNGVLTRQGTYIPKPCSQIRMAPAEYKLASPPYDLWKLRAKSLVEKIPHPPLPASLPPWLVFLKKLYEKIYAPLTCRHSAALSR